MSIVLLAVVAVAGRLGRVVGLARYMDRYRRARARGGVQGWGLAGRAQGMRWERDVTAAHA